MLNKAQESANLFIDETPVDCVENKQVRKGFVWVLVGGSTPNPPHRVYVFKESRSHEHAFNLPPEERLVFRQEKEVALSI